MQFSNHSGKKQTSVAGASAYSHTSETFIIDCPKHAQQILYFCKICEVTVCHKCIYESHSTHKLVKIKNLASFIQGTIEDLQKVMHQTQTQNLRTQTILRRVIKQLGLLHKRQCFNVQHAFDEIYKKLEIKKKQFLQDAEFHFTTEQRRMQTMLDNMTQKEQQIGTVERVFDQLIQFMDQNVDEVILEKAYSISEFIYKSNKDLDSINTEQKDVDKEAYI